MKRTLFFICLCVFFIGCESIPKDLFPVSGGEVVKHSYYSLSYLEEHEQAEWVYYVLTPEMINGDAKRNNDFKVDTSVISISATLEDYKYSGYDRGHLAPAASMNINEVAMSESFLMSNMSPQIHAFNGGAWGTLEAYVRTWVREEGLIHVVTGPVLREDSLGTIGENEVTIPWAYYKVIFAPDARKMIGFILPHKKIELPIRHYAVTVDSVECITGIDFFAELRDGLEIRLEKRFDISDWKFESSDGNARNARNNTNNKEPATNNRCSAVTSSGNQCKRSAEVGSKFCWQHK